VNDPRARAAAAVVQIDDGAVEREGLLDLAPVVLVRADLAVGMIQGEAVCRLRAPEAVVAEGGGDAERRGTR
jgi:hypothetical protein